MEKIFDPLTFQVGEPSDEEISTVQERWRKFIQTMTDIQGGLRGVQSKIDIGPKAADALRLAEEMAAKNSPTDQSNTVTSRKAITDSSRAGSGSPRRPIRARLRAFSRRVLSCISLKHFG
ncbi:hypothetical protein AN958_08747 [Leucoagaricus sp. SymC.cos]|nr:hypothetical protein AN958_08747 [Leucoagaricus sp. SymC.cos]